MSSSNLKVFVAGEDILASDTNDNNQYILNQITSSTGAIVSQLGSTNTSLANLTNNFNTLDSTAVKITGAQTIAGNKTFTGDLVFSGTPEFTNGVTIPLCDEPATTTSTASESLFCPVVQNYKNGGSWYRIYSDGWVEQGGWNNTSTNFDVTFLIEMADTNYTRWVTGSCNDDSQSGHNYMHTLTTTGAKVRGFNQRIGTTYYGTAWGVAGYMKVVEE